MACLQQFALILGIMAGLKSRYRTGGGFPMPPRLPAAAPNTTGI